MYSEQVRIHSYSHYPIPYIDILIVELDEKIIKLVPESVTKQFQIIPIDLLGKILTLGIVNPTKEKIEALKLVLPQYHLSFFLIDEEQYHFKLNFLPKLTEVQDKKETFTLNLTTTDFAYMEKLTSK